MEFTSADDSCTPVVKDLRIVLLGKTGSGKSATGNTILNRTAFISDMSPDSVTKRCKKETGHFDEQTVSVIDTPGIFDTSIEEKELEKEIENCIMLSLPGPHIFLLVISLAGRFTKEENAAVKWITEKFGEEASKYTIVVFTRGDELKETIESFVHKNPDLTKLTRDCKAGYVVFDNTCVGNRTQVADLLRKIDKAVKLNGGHYTSSIYKEAERKLRWRRIGDNLKSAGPYVIGAGVAAAVTPVAGGGAIILREFVTKRPLLLAGCAIVATAVNLMKKPQTKNN